MLLPLVTGPALRPSPLAAAGPSQVHRVSGKFPWQGRCFGMPSRHIATPQQLCVAAQGNNSLSIGKCEAETQITFTCIYDRGQPPLLGKCLLFAIFSPASKHSPGEVHVSKVMCTRLQQGFAFCHDCNYSCTSAARYQARQWCRGVTPSALTTFTSPPMQQRNVRGGSFSTTGRSQTGWTEAGPGPGAYQRVEHATQATLLSQPAYSFGSGRHGRVCRSSLCCSDQQ